MENIVEYLASKSVILKQQGKEYVGKCIFCDDKKTHFSVNPDKNVWHCWKCGEAGNIVKLKRHYGDIKIVEFKQENKFKKPESIKVKKMHEELLKTDSALKFLYQERGLKLTTIQHFKLGYDNGRIAMPYFKNGELVNIKYRAIANKSFDREKDCESTLYNMDEIDKSKPLMVVEGEMDCMAAWQMGFINVVSISVGAGTVDPAWLEYFDNFEKIYIVYDNDSEGNRGAQLLASKLDSRVFRVYLPCKDMNECLMAGYTKEKITEYILASKEHKPDSLVHVSSVIDELSESFKDGEKAKGHQVKEWHSFTEAIGGIRDCEITIVTGDTNIGKSTWSVNLIYQFIKNDMPVLFISSEMPNKIILRKLYCIYKGKSTFEMSEQEIGDCISYFATKKIYFTKNKSVKNINDIEDAIKYGAKRLDIKHILIDHLHHFIDDSEDKLVSEINKFMRKIKDSSMDNNAHILIVAHPHQLKNDKGHVSIQDLKGSTSIKQDADNVISVHRDKKDDNEPLKVKFLKIRDDSGHLKTVEFLFTKKSQTYYEGEKL